MKKAIPWIIYVAFVGVLIYGAVVRTISISSGQRIEGYDLQQGNGQYFRGREGNPAGEPLLPRWEERRNHISPDHFPDDDMERPRWGRSGDHHSGRDGWYLPPRSDKQMPEFPPRDYRRGNKRPFPTIDEVLNHYAERYLHADELLKEGEEK